MVNEWLLGLFALLKASTIPFYLLCSPFLLNSQTWIWNVLCYLICWLLFIFLSPEARAGRPAWIIVAIKYLWHLPWESAWQERCLLFPILFEPVVWSMHRWSLNFFTITPPIPPVNSCTIHIYTTEDQSMWSTHTGLWGRSKRQRKQQKIWAHFRKMAYTKVA